MIELPDTKEIINILLSYGDYINMTLTVYHHDVYCKRIIATYYVTDGLMETFKTISIFVKDNNILVQTEKSEKYLMTYDNFKKRYECL